MVKFKELLVEELTCRCNPDIFKFSNTEQVPPLEGIIGQEKAVKAMEFGLFIKSPGYNLYMAGMSGTGKTTYAENLVRQVAQTEDIPDDWCYVYNFERLGQPVALSLPPGKGAEFAKDMENLVEELLLEIPKAFDTEEYERQKAAISKEYQDLSGDLMDDLTSYARDLGFTLKKTSGGFMSVPVRNGKAMKTDDFAALSEEETAAIEAKANQLQEKSLEIMRKIRNAEREMKDRTSELEKQTGLFAVGHPISELKEKYLTFPDILQYLANVQKDILEHLDNFLGTEEEEGEAVPWIKGSAKDSALRKYRVNLLVDNSKTLGAPVVVEVNPTYYNLLGRVEYKNELGVMSTDFTRIKAGALHRANGGYLILQAHDVLSSVQAWEALKRVLKTEEVRIENLGDQMGSVAVATLKPSGIPVQVKVILIGSSQIYHLLYNYEEDFKKLFKVKVDFDTEMPLNETNVHKMASFVSALCHQRGLKHFEPSGVAKLVEYSARLADHQRKLTTCFNELVEILYEADAWCAIEDCNYITGKHVQRAIREKMERSNIYEMHLQEMFEDGTILVDTHGEVIGQVNGLSILDFGDYDFGKPSRITAATYLGQRGVVNIEREVEMSGTSHSKGVLILSGYLGAKYAQEFPLTLSASLCFEQLYDGVDGDSASSTELYAILSSLAELPIKQAIAVTGSVNQKGEIQPVGGVTRKIEGYFHVCKARGLTAEQGVIIPHQNVENLLLCDEVVEAVRAGQFHIYPVRTIDEGIAILTGREVGVADKDGEYPEGTVNYLVQEKLIQNAKAIENFGQDKQEIRKMRRRRR